jgi:hypothetical protein
MKQVKVVVMRQMLMVVAMLAVMVAGLAAPAMAEEVQNPLNDPPPVEEEPYKDPGIRQCDLSPTPCENIDEEEPYRDPGIRQCDLSPTPCQDTDEEEEEAAEEPYKDPGIRQCDLSPTSCENIDDSSDEDGHNSVVDPNTDDTDPVEEEPKEDEASTPDGVKAGVVPRGIPTPTAQANDPSAAPKEAVSTPDEAGQTADSGLVYDICAYDDYHYDEAWGVCVPNGMFLGAILGDEPWPESAGGYVGLLGDLVEDPLTGLGLGLQVGLGSVGDALIEFGEGGGPIGWGIQGLGYTLDFFGDAGGTLIGGVGETVGAVADGVGDVVDAIGDAAGAAWDEVSSWW